MPFFYISIRQGLNYSNTLLNNYYSVQATYFIIVNSPGPLLIILILTYIKNPLNLYTSLLNRLTDGILTN